LRLQAFVARDPRAPVQPVRSPQATLLLNLPAATTLQKETKSPLASAPRVSLPVFAAQETVFPAYLARHPIHYRLQVPDSAVAQVAQNLQDYPDRNLFQAPATGTTVAFE